MRLIHAILLHFVDADNYEPYGFGSRGWELFVYDRGMSLTRERVERWRWLRNQ